MKIRDIMTPDVEVLRPDATLLEAARKMRDLDVGALPVCDGRRLQGMIKEQDPRTARSADVMTPDVAYCFDDQDVSEAAKIMRERQIRRLPIVDRDRSLVGIVSLGDLAVDTGDEKMSGRVLEDVSAPARPRHRGTTPNP
jgi:CBS domain-containing protein